MRTYEGLGDGYTTNTHHTTDVMASGAPHTAQFGEAKIGSSLHFHDCVEAKAVSVPSFEAVLVAES